MLSEGAGIPGGGGTAVDDDALAELDAVADVEATDNPGGGGGALATEGVTDAKGAGLRFGDVCALFVVMDMLESVLFPRAIAGAFSLFSFFSLITGVCTGEGVGRGNATLLFSGRAVATDVGGLTGREVPIGTAVRAAGRATGIPFPHAAEFGSADAAVSVEAF